MTDHQILLIIMFASLAIAGISKAWMKYTLKHKGFEVDQYGEQGADLKRIYNLMVNERDGGEKVQYFTAISSYTIFVFVGLMCIGKLFLNRYIEN